MKNIQCKLFGHDFKVTRKVTDHVKEFTCKSCKKQLTINSNGHLIDLSPKFKEINDVLERVYHKRHHKKSSDQNVNNNLLVFRH